MNRHHRETDYRQWLEDDLRYSTSADHDWRAGGHKYTSARDAVDRYLRLQSDMDGQPAIDYEQAMCVDASPAPENPASTRAHEAFFLEKVFRATRRDVEIHQWRVWCLVCGVRFGDSMRGEPIDQRSFREAARMEGRYRRAELQRLHHLDDLESWCEAYGLPFPSNQKDPFEYRMEKPGITSSCPKTAKRYRDAVDAQLEQHLVGRGAFVGTVRPGEGERDELRGEGRAA
ncbi:MAG: hypothetical protein ABEN55_13365 [Bradymonadaceae bacterium]